MERRSLGLLLSFLVVGPTACGDPPGYGRGPSGEDSGSTADTMDDSSSDSDNGEDSGTTEEDSSGEGDTEDDSSDDDSDSEGESGSGSDDSSDTGTGESSGDEGSSDGGDSTDDSSEDGSGDSGDSGADDGPTGDDSGTDEGSEDDGSTGDESTGDESTGDSGTDAGTSDSGSGDGTGTDTECDPGFADCDEEPGCETDVSGGDLDHCGVCDKSCNLGGASEASCMDGTCTVRFVVPVTQDSYTSSADPGENNGNYNALWVDGGADVYTAYLQASMPTMPTNVTVTEGTLVTMCYEAGEDATAYRITQAWEESTITAATAPSVDMGTGLDTQTPTGSFGAPDPVVFDVAAAIQQWLDGTANYGIALLGSGTDGSSHHSSEASSASNRPEFDFTVTY